VVTLLDPGPYVAPLVPVVVPVVELEVTLPAGFVVVWVVVLLSRDPWVPIEVEAVSSAGPMDVVVPLTTVPVPVPVSVVVVLLLTVVAKQDSDNEATTADPAKIIFRTKSCFLDIA